MSDITRIVIDLPKLDGLQQHSVLAAIRQALSRTTLPKCDIDEAIQVPATLTFTQLLETQQSEGYQCDHVSLPDHPEFINGEEADGGYVTALLWVEGIERPVTMERLLVLREQGFLAGVGDKHLEGLLAYVHEQFSPTANISTADLEELDEAYARTLEEDHE